MSAAAERTDAPADRVPTGGLAGPGLVPGVLVAFLGVTVLLTVVVGYCSGSLGAGVPGPDAGPAWLAGWFHGDGTWYCLIADAGYSYTPGTQSSVAFFPVFPMLLRGFGVLLGDYRVGGWLLGVLSGGLSVLLFTGWVRTRLPRAATLTAVGVLLVYPYAFFLHGAVYSDGLFLVTAIGAFLLVEGRMFWAAGMVGALATAGRPVGVAVAVGLLVRVVEIRAEAGVGRVPLGRAGGSAEDRSAVSGAPGAQVPVRRPTLRELARALGSIGWRPAGVLVSLVGVAAWCGYLWVRFGDPLVFLTVQGAPGWDQGSGPATWFKVAYLLDWQQRLRNPVLLLTAQALAGLVAVLLLPRVRRRFGWGYTAYCVIALAIPIIGTKDFMGLGRYVLAAFPVFAAAADALAGGRHRWLGPAVLGMSTGLLLVATVLFANGVEVS